VLYHYIEQQLNQALARILPEAGDTGLVVRPCPDKRFGDYQTSSLIALAKQRKLNPRQLAADVSSRLQVQEWCEKVEVAGAGFLNFFLKNSAVAEALGRAMADPSLLIKTAKRQRTVVIDFSSPNVAKPMHVGHIRSTILGDALARTYRLLGHRVITDNHLGDWGTQFGKLLVGWKQFLNPEALAQDPIQEMERLYKLINEKCQSDNQWLELARQELVKLQGGDSENLRLWKEMIDLSQRQFNVLYRHLGVQFDYLLGESFYNDRLKSLVEAFCQQGVAKESEGALVVFFDDITELKDHPVIIQKSDGAANYATTDLATLAYRVEQWHPDEIIYVTDGRQLLHFKQVFTAFRRWQPSAKVGLVHVWFGSILGDDGKPFKTRSGETVKLVDLLDEAEVRAYKVVTEKSPELSDEDRREISRIVGLGSVKYADLLPNRQSDYVFNWDKMLAFNGNTAPYLLYAYTRIRSIFRKLASEGYAWPDTSAGKSLALSKPEELDLAKHLLNFGLVLETMIEEHRPNFLCNYLYDLAGYYARFYESCPVLKSEGQERSSRLALCEMSGRILKQGLEALGLETTDKM
jgi:arginyl-tRNA synthetase